MRGHRSRPSARRVVIFGAGSFARLVCMYLRSDSEHEVTAFTVDGAYLEESTLLGVPVIAFEDLESSLPPKDVALVIAIGYSRVNEVRRTVYERCQTRGYDFINYVHSSTTIPPGVELGENSLILEENIIQPFARIGNNVVIWSGAHVGHDSVIEDHCFVAPRAAIAGYVTVGRSSFVGINATVRDGVRIGEDCVIGAGALIKRDAQAGEVHAPQGSDPLLKKSSELYR